MLTALTVGNTILNRAFVEDIDITPMKLQRLLYFLYKDYYKKTNRTLFDERFETWKFGPVLPSVYQEFKDRGANSIKRYAANDDGKVYTVDEDSSPIFKNSLNTVWSKYKNFDGTVLSSLTHRQNTAWRKAVDAGENYLSDLDIKQDEDFDIFNRK